MPKANLGPFSRKARPFLGPSRCRCRASRPWAVCAGGGFGGGFSRLTPPASPKVVVKPLHRLGCQPQNTSQRPLSTIPAANVPHFPLIRSPEGAAARRIHRSALPTRGRRSRCSARTHRHRQPSTALTVRPRKPFLSLQIPKLRGGTVCAAGRAWQRKPLLHRCPIYSPL